MAKSSGMGGILKIALVAGGGYYLYNMLTKAPAAAGSTGTAPGSSSLADIVAAVKSALGTTPAAGTPTAPASSDGLVAELKLAAKDNTLFQNGKGTPDYWNYYRNQLHPPLLTDMRGAFADPSAFISAEDFVAGLKRVGLAGYGLGAVPVVLPKRMNVGGRAVLVVPRTAHREYNAESMNYIARGPRVLA